MKFVEVMWYFIVMVAILKSVSSADSIISNNEGNEYDDDYDDDYEDEIATDETSTFDDLTTTPADPECDPQSFNESDTFLVLNQNCTNFVINLEFENETSIINVTMSIERKGTLPQDDLTTARDMKVDIYERTFLENGEEMNILQEEWKENSPKVRTYLSLSPRAYINISRTGNWSDMSINFTFNEIEHSLKRKNSTALLSGGETVLYEPNSVFLYSLREGANKEIDGIEIKFENLNINKTMGEYLLIGPGTELFKNKNFKPLYVTELTEYSKFYVGCETAYVAFVSGSTQKEGEFKILWNRTEAKVPDPKGNYLDNLKSSPICFRRNSTENTALPQQKKERFKSFRKDFAAFINKKYNNNRLNETSIILFGYPTDATINSSETLEIIIKVIDKEGRSIFKWSELQVIIGEFENNTTGRYHGYLVRKCPLKELPYKDDWSVALYSMTPMFALCALLVWAWKQNIFARRCKSEEGDELVHSFHLPISADPNTIENTRPKDFETSEDDEDLRYIPRRTSKPRPSLDGFMNKNEEATELKLIKNSESNKTEYPRHTANGTIKTGVTKL